MGVDEPLLTGALQQAAGFRLFVRDLKSAELSDISSRVVSRLVVLGALAAVTALGTVFAVSFAFSGGAQYGRQFGIPPVLQHPGFSEALSIFGGNFLVLMMYSMLAYAFYAVLRQPVPSMPSEETPSPPPTLAGRSTLAVTALIAIGLSIWCVQAFLLAKNLTQLATLLNLTRIDLVVSISPHGILELTGIFLPVAAVFSVVRSHNWSLLPARLVVSIIIGSILILIAAGIETLVWGDLLRAFAPPGLSPLDFVDSD